MRFCMLVLGVCAALVETSASAHGPQIQVTVGTNSNNKIVTRQLLLDEPYSSAVGLTAPAEIYVMPVLPVSYLGQSVARVTPSDTQTFGPGFTYGYDQTLGTDHFFTANLNLHVGGLEIWDGTNFVPTGTGKEQLGLLQSTSNVNADAVKTTAAGGDIAIPVTAGYTADVHSSMRYTLLGDGLDPYAASRDGIYLVSLQLSATQAAPSLSPADPFYFVLDKNGTGTELATAVDSLLASTGISRSLVQYTANVPEPVSSSLLAGGLTIGLLPRRRLWLRKRGDV
jgi:hypothetical protein